MAVRDLLWGCPLCRAPDGIRPHGRAEKCRACGARFRRGRGVVIVAERAGVVLERTAAEWSVTLGPAQTPDARPDGIILGPERVTVKVTRNQKTLRFRGDLLGWVEVYGKARRGVMTLRVDGLLFQPDTGTRIEWAPGDLTGLQPASSALQLGLHGQMASVRFREASVRLWTRALSDLLRNYYHSLGREVVELQPVVRTRILTESVP
jgi:hypothetical protein